MKDLYTGFKVLLAIAIMALVVHERVYAADITVGTFDDGEKFINLDGPIDIRDDEVLKAALDSLHGRQGDIYLYLNSPGGLGGPMRAILEYLPNYNVVTVVDQDAYCFSACSAIWSFGKRVVQRGNGVIGYHVASYPEEAFDEGFKLNPDFHPGIVAQYFTQESFKESLKLYAEFPVNHPYEFAWKISQNGWTSTEFWNPSEEEFRYFFDNYEKDTYR